MSGNGKAAITPTRKAAIIEAVADYTGRAGGKRHPSDYPAPYPYWLRGKVNRIRR